MCENCQSLRKVYAKFATGECTNKCGSRVGKKACLFSATSFKGKVITSKNADSKLLARFLRGQRPSIRVLGLFLLPRGCFISNFAEKLVMKFARCFVWR